MTPADKLLVPWRPQTAAGNVDAQDPKSRPVPANAWLVDPETPPPTAWTLYQATRLHPTPPALFVPDPAYDGQAWYENLPVFEDLKPRFIPETQDLPPWTAFDKVAFRPSSLRLDVYTRQAGKTRTHTWDACLYLPHSERDYDDDGPQPVAVRHAGLDTPTVTDLLYKAYFAFNPDGDTYDTQKERFLRYAEATAARMLHDPDTALETAVRATALPMLAFLMAPGRRFTVVVNGPHLVVRATESSQAIGEAGQQFNHGC